MHVVLAKLLSNLVEIMVTKQDRDDAGKFLYQLLEWFTAKLHAIRSIRRAGSI